MSAIIATQTMTSVVAIYLKGYPVSTISASTPDSRATDSRPPGIVSVVTVSVSIVGIAVGFVVLHRYRKRDVPASKPKEILDTYPEADSNNIYELSDGKQFPEMNETFGSHPEADSNMIHELNEQQLPEMNETFGSHPEADSNAIHELNDGEQLAELNETFGSRPEADSNVIHELNEQHNKSELSTSPSGLPISKLGKPEPCQPQIDKPATNR